MLPQVARPALPSHAGMLDDQRLRLLAYLAAAALLAVAAVRYLDANASSGGGGGGPPAVALGEGGTGAGGGGAPAVAAGARGRLYVHVAGEVRKPGLYRLPAGARVAEAVERAGGPARRAELAGVNLAAPLEDGQQVIVPRRGAGGAGGAPAAGGPPGAAGAVGGAKISLATATPEQLETVDGIGPALSKRILEYRDQNGGFRSLEQLMEVDGIGEKRFETLRGAVRP